MSTFDPEILEMMQYGFESGAEGAFEEKLAKFKPKKRHIRKFRKELGLTGNPDKGFMGYMREGIFGRSRDTKKAYDAKIKELKKARRTAKLDYKTAPDAQAKAKAKKTLKAARRDLVRAKKIMKKDRPSALQRTVAIGGAAAVPVFAAGAGAAGGYLAGNN